ncbi:Methyl-accepting chemotaxis protein 4 [Shewanella baltica]|uniref:HAMP domain-containing methyl-accepting chemotaxis protein n=1 Tax=Shewanella baltica TaxID=62322 RepID=UPI0001530A41|nr:methyl-accepting chemotaxis protein [Shewanella baltica]ACK47438.1 methyl-accepting chemotaxis sensory transducer [Shewanella baltica OS223]AVT46431.1 methyl-accepting chemotaxis protein [Shewanella baltica]MCS6099324.1 HAMP domain-containing protein [Shewanella baltica]MCS6117601.1 HAMP domain-containing protein [Shewanella baltica]MCS6182609.1 HAMP domain-containing protein [Shewanella baltica]
MLTLTIKQKIIFSFSAIGALLIAGSSFFYYSLSQVQTAYQNIETLAVPVQKQSNSLQLVLLKMSRLATLAHSQQDTAALTKSQQAFTALQKKYQSIENELTERVADQSKMQTSLHEAQARYQAYLQQSQAMFSAKLANEQAKQQYQQLFQRFNDAKTNASNAMIDLETLSIPDNPTLLEEIVGTGTRIDDMLYTLTNTMGELIHTQSLEVIQSHQQDVSILLGNLTTNFTFLKQQTDGLDTLGLLQTFEQQYAIINTLLAAPAELYKTQQAVVEAQLQAEQHYLDADKEFNANNLALDKLITLADRRFSSLQTIASNAIEQGQTLAIVLALVFIVMVSFISFFTSKAMLNPLALVNGALASIARGDLSKRIHKRHDDEFGTLIDNMNTLSDDLAKLLTNISQNAHSLDSSATQTNEQGQRIANAATAQISRVDETKALAEQMFTSSNLVTEQASESAKQISQASKYGNQVKQIADDNRNKIAELSARLSSSVEVMSRLSIQSDNIGSILTTISSIAEQTNLLALNAAIEAARAGEHGRGFAVVADEVRSLASRTQAATAEIQTMITALQKETSTAASAITTGQNQANECVGQSQTLQDAIAHIESTLHTLNDMSLEITHAAHEQLDYSQRIESSMSEAAQAADQNANEAMDMAKRSNEVTTLAHSLTSSVERFKL